MLGPVSHPCIHDLWWVQERDTQLALIHDFLPDPFSNRNQAHHYACDGVDLPAGANDVLLCTARSPQAEVNVQERKKRPNED